MTDPKQPNVNTPTNRKPVTAAHLSNARAGFLAAGMDFDRLKQADREYLARLWALHVDAGEDFASAAAHVMDRLETAAARAEKLKALLPDD